MMSVYLTEEIAREHSCSLAYYFCAGQEIKRNTASAVLRGLLWQITEQHPTLMRHVMPHFDPPERGQATILSEETLWKLFEEICLDAGTQRLFCLVDGVDECDEDSMHWLVEKFLSVGCDPTYVKLSLIVLSRPLNGLDESTCITLDPDHQGQVSDDVDLFVRSKVRQLSQKLRLDESFEINAAKILLEKSEGTFLWVGFVMSELLKKGTRTQVEKAMENLPKGLPAVYARMLQGIDADCRDTSRKLLTCISLAFRKLSLHALADILGCRPSATISEEQATLDQIATCAPMLQLRGQAAEFVHQSAKEYLLRVEPDFDPVLESFRIQPEEAHLYLTRRCLRSLVEGTYLQYYSLLNWPRHAKHLNDLAPHLFEQEHPFFGESSPLRDVWWRKYSPNFAGLPDVVPPRLHIACFVGLETWARAIIVEEKHSGKTHAYITSEQCSSGWLALDYAAEGGVEKLLELLLDDQFNGKCPSHQLDSALQRAVLAHRAGAVELLLRAGANANGSYAEGKSLLLYTTASSNRTIERLLLEHGANPLIEDDNHVYRLKVSEKITPARRALLKARERNSFEQQLLGLVDLSRGIGDDQMHFKTDGAWTSSVYQDQLENDAMRRQEMIRSLLGRKLDINVRDAVGRTVLHILAAASCDDRDQQRDLTQILLDAGVDINAKKRDGKTALHVATKHESFKTAAILCDRGVNVNESDSLGETALHCAARQQTIRSAFRLVGLLSQAGADLDAQNSKGETPLHAATKSRCVASMVALLRHGARVNVRDLNDDTALDVAIGLGHPKLVRVLRSWTEATELQPLVANPDDDEATSTSTC